MAEAALSIFLRHIHRMIPRQLLQAAFGPGGPNNWNGTTNLDKAIKEAVWLDTLADVNVHCGKYRIIILQRDWKLPLNREQNSPYDGSGYYSGVYHIPPHARDFGPITQVSHVENLCAYAGVNAANNGLGGSFVSMGNTATGLASAALNSRTLSSYMDPPTVELLDNQTVKITPDDRIYSSDLRLNCLIGYDQEMTNADQTTLEAVKELFLCDVKIYIYNTLDISTNESEIVAGSEISRFKDRLMEYAGALDERKELLATMRSAKYYDPAILKQIISYAI